MPLFILGLFIAVPIIEIAVFIEIGGRIGLWNTIAVVIVTAMIGTWMLRAQGLKTLENARRNMERLSSCLPSCPSVTARLMSETIVSR